MSVLPDADIFSLVAVHVMNNSPTAQFTSCGNHVKIATLLMRLAVVFSLMLVEVVFLYSRNFVDLKVRRRS